MDDAIRLGIFVFLFIALAIAEYIWPRRAQLLSRQQRWPQHLFIAFLNVGLVRLILPMSLVGVAMGWQGQEWGLLPVLNLPSWLNVLIAIVLLDLIIYGQHIIFHKVPFLWRMHRMHHADTEFDVTTALRFHPFEIVISLMIKIVAIILLGVPAEAVILFEIILNSTAMFSHSNIALPSWLDRFVRLLFVTPDMHRVHHSAIEVETNSNFGFNISLWDKIFKTCRADPARGHTQMVIGLEEFRELQETRLFSILLQPFRSL